MRGVAMARAFDAAAAASGECIIIAEENADPDDDDDENGRFEAAAQAATLAVPNTDEEMVAIGQVQPAVPGYGTVMSSLSASASVCASVGSSTGVGRVPLPLSASMASSTSTAGSSFTSIVPPHPSSASHPTSSSSSSSFHSFVHSSVYHAFETEIREEGSVDLSRRSGGGLQRSRSKRGKKMRGAINAGNTAASASSSSSSTTSGDSSTSNVDAANAAAAIVNANMMFDLIENEEEKGDYAIIVRLERKLFAPPIQAQIPTAPPSAEHSSNGHGQQSIDQETERAAVPPSSSVSLPTVGAVAPAPSPTPAPAFSFASSSIHPPLDPTSPSSLLHHSPRLRTIYARLRHAGLKLIHDAQVVNQSVLLKVYAESERLERAAAKLRLKMPLKPRAERLYNATHEKTPQQAKGVEDAASSTSSSSSSRCSSITNFFSSIWSFLTSLNSSELLGGGSGGVGGGIPAHRLPTHYVFVPFDPSIREEFLGTSDANMIFRSSERQILIDYILRSSRMEGGAGLGEQRVNEQQVQMMHHSKKKKKEMMEKKKKNRKSSTTATQSNEAAPSSITSGNTSQAERDDDDASSSSSSDDEEAGTPRRSASSTTSTSTSNGMMDGCSDDDDEVPHIERYICSRFPLHSSRLDALDSWVSYRAGAALRRRLGNRAWISWMFFQPLEGISKYFGNEVGFYYAFLNFYTRSLVVPTLMGLVLFIAQLLLNDLDSPLLPLFSLAFAIWASVLIEIWKRRESSLAWSWGSFEYEMEEESPRPEFRGIFIRDRETGMVKKVYPLWKRVGKTMLSALFWMTVLVAFGTMMIVIFSRWDQYVHEIKSVDLGGMTLPLDVLFVPCVWGIMIPVFDALFLRLALRVTYWENWKRASTFQTMLICKVFPFRFINAFLALYYYMFTDAGSLVRLTTSVASFLIIGQILRFLISVAEPYIQKKWNGWNTRRKAQRARARTRNTQQGATGAGTSNNTLSTDDADGVQLSSAWMESTYPEYDHFEEYTNMAIQFGYVCFFSVAFPFAPLCALINNLVMCRVGAFKLCRLTRRPLARRSSGIGIWLNVLQLMSVCAVLTNCGLIAVTSLQLSSWFPSLDRSTKILLIFAFEHVIILLKFVIAVAIPHVPSEVRQQRKKEKLALDQANTELLDLRRKEIIQRTHASESASIDQMYAVTL